jgi:hypothetical protein
MMAHWEPGVLGTNVGNLEIYFAGPRYVYDNGYLPPPVELQPQIIGPWPSGGNEPLYARYYEIYYGDLIFDYWDWTSRFTFDCSALYAGGGIRADTTRSPHFSLRIYNINNCIGGKILVGSDEVVLPSGSLFWPGTVISQDISWSSIASLIECSVSAPGLSEAPGDALSFVCYTYGAPSLELPYEYFVVELQTLPATDITNISAVLHGINDECSDVHFGYEIYDNDGNVLNSGVTANQTVGDTAPFSANLSLPTGWVSVSFWAEGTCEGNVYQGNQEYFELPTGGIETLPAKYITKTSAYIGARYTGTVKAQAGWQWKRSNSWQILYWWAQSPFSINSPREFWFNWRGLNAGRTYKYRAFIIVDGIYYYGDEMSFTTDMYPVIFKPGYSYLTAKEAIDPVVALALGRYYMDAEGNLQYESRFRRTTGGMK